MKKKINFGIIILYVKKKKKKQIFENKKVNNPFYK
jgi:hypothetical protein